MTKVEREHIRDGIGICLRCNLCLDSRCCPQPVECEGRLWSGVGET